jgi:hypothetical protein
MSAALSDNNTINRCAAYLACFTGALINLKVVLILTTAIYPINAGTIMDQSLLERISDANPKGMNFFPIKAVASA